MRDRKRTLGWQRPADLLDSAVSAATARSSRWPATRTAMRTGSALRAFA